MSGAIPSTLIPALKGLIEKYRDCSSKDELKRKIKDAAAFNGFSLKDINDWITENCVMKYGEGGWSVKEGKSTFFSPEATQNNQPMQRRSAGASGGNRNGIPYHQLAALVFEHRSSSNKDKLTRAIYSSLGSPKKGCSLKAVKGWITTHCEKRITQCPGGAGTEWLVKPTANTSVQPQPFGGTKRPSSPGINTSDGSPKKQNPQQVQPGKRPANLQPSELELERKDAAKKTRKTEQPPDEIQITASLNKCIADILNTVGAAVMEVGLAAARLGGL
jgi:hypothetical protein